jgi:hypothetical protein
MLNLKFEEFSTRKSSLIFDSENLSIDRKSGDFR